MLANDNTAPLEEAADWIDRLDELTDADRLELQAWLRASDDNTAAFERMRRTLRDPALLAAAEQVRAWAFAPQPPAPRREPAAAPAARPTRVRAPRRMGLIAAGLAAVGVAAALVGFRVMDKAAEPPLEFATAVGARSDYGLSDTSVVHLNANSRVSVRFSRAARDLTLAQGDAMFDVAKNPRRPFNVDAGAAVITAVGTSFEVDRLDGAVEVRVFEGVVRVAQPGGQVFMARKGEWLRLVSGVAPASGSFQPELDQTWRSDWLVAEQTPLKYVVARLNRYSRNEIVVRDAATGELKVTGRFRLSRTADALAMISALLGVDAAHSGERIEVAPHRADAKAPAQPT